MSEKTEWEELTDKEQEIVETAVENPDMTHKEIAEETDSSASYVGKTRREYEDRVTVTEEESGGSGNIQAIILLLLIAGALYWAVTTGII